MVLMKITAKGQIPEILACADPVGVRHSADLGEAVEATA